MAVKTIVLGFGGTGTHILTYLKELAIYKHGHKPNHLAFIEMDTIARSLWHPGETVTIGGGPRETIAVGLGQEQIMLDPKTEYLALEDAHPPLRSLAEVEMSGGGRRDLYPQLKDWLHTDWLKKIVPGAALNVESGAAQQRQIGRFAMVGNVTSITNAITKAVGDLKLAVPEGNVVRAWLVCSSAGGTGAGCIIDGAAIVRMVAHQLGLTPMVTAIVALPEVYANTSGISPARAFSFFRELERFQGIGLVTPADEIDTGEPAQPIASSIINYDRDGRQSAVVPTRLFDYLFYLGENCPTLPRRISFFNSVATAVDTFLDDNIGPAMMEELINKDGHPMTFGGSRLTIPLNTYSELFVWEQASEYLRAIGAPMEQPDLPVSGVHSGSPSDREDAAHQRVDNLLPLFQELRGLTAQDRNQLPQFAERELEPRTIVKRWYQFAETNLSDVQVTEDQLFNDVPLTYCNPFVFFGDDNDSIRPEQVEIKTYSEGSKAKTLKENQEQSLDRFQRQLSDRLGEFIDEAGGVRSFARGRKVVGDSITTMLHARIDSRLAREIGGLQRIAGDPERPTEGTPLTRLYEELTYLRSDRGPLFGIQDVLTKFAEYLDGIIGKKRQEAVEAIGSLKAAQKPPLAWIRGNWADAPQINARDTCMDYIRTYQKQQLIHDMRGIVTRVRGRFTEWQTAIRDVLTATVVSRDVRTALLSDIQTKERNRLTTRLHRLAQDERALISLKPRADGGADDIGMNGYADTLRQRSTVQAGASLALHLAGRSRWVAAAVAGKPPKISLSILADGPDPAIQVPDLDGLKLVLLNEFSRTVKARLAEVDIFDYLLYEQAQKNLDRKAVATRLQGSATLLLAGGAGEGFTRWVYKAPVDRDKLNYAQALQADLGSLIVSDNVKSPMENYSDRLTLILLRDARREHGQIPDIQRCVEQYLATQIQQRTGRGDTELDRALVYHPFRGEADAWLIERLTAQKTGRRFGEDDLIPPRVVRLLDQPDYFRAFVHCLGTGTVRKSQEEDRWQWHVPGRQKPVDLDNGDLIRAAVIFCLWKREAGAQNITRITVQAALDSAARAAADKGGLAAALKAFVEPAALDAFLTAHLKPPALGPVPERDYKRLKSGLAMAIQFYGDPRVTANLPDREI